MCSNILLKEREKSDSEGDASKVVKQKCKHSFHTNFRKYLKRSFPRTEESGDMKIVERKSESRNNHQFAAVVQDIVIQWTRVKPKLHRRRRRILRKFRCFCSQVLRASVIFVQTQAGDLSMAARVSPLSYGGAASRRRERRLRSFQDGVRICEAPRLAVSCVCRRSN